MKREYSANAGQIDSVSKVGSQSQAFENIYHSAKCEMNF